MPEEVSQENLGKLEGIQNNLEYRLKDSEAPFHHKLNNLDAVARLILAISHTTITKGPDKVLEDIRKSKGILPGQKYEPTEQEKISITSATVQLNIGTGIKTVAVVRNGSTLLVAQNNLFNEATGGGLVPASEGERSSIIDTARAAVLGDLGKASVVTDVKFINPTYDGSAFHAEMQLLQYCISQSRAISGGVMGVSKPCCGYCAFQLDTAKVDYSLWIGKPVKNWMPPKGNYKKLRRESDPHNFAKWYDLKLSSKPEQKIKTITDGKM